MITHITGRVQSIEDGCVCLEVHGVSFGIAVPDTHACTVGEQASLHTYLHWNQDQGPTLFGFKRDLDRKVFLLIISCSGIGPRIALSLLAELGAERFLGAVKEGDDRALTTVNGIGAKKAEQIVVQLKHKVAKIITAYVQLDPAFKDTSLHNIAEVLNSLNYSRNEVAGAMQYIRQTAAQEPQPFDQLMRKALSFLAKKV
jgi:Holliday junction DNA helicase RuvA